MVIEEHLYAHRKAVQTEVEVLALRTPDADGVRKVLAAVVAVVLGSTHLHCKTEREVRSRSR